MTPADVFFTAAQAGGSLVNIAVVLGPGLIVAGAWSGYRAYRRARQQCLDMLREARIDEINGRAPEAERQRMRDLARLVNEAPLMPTRPGPKDRTYRQLEALYNDQTEGNR